ncbi:hypothetical protein Bca52824_001342 [Brassica carinata]|uniref:Uncharacterized protein n=1 Tax=Brassica carinata TaxID=52824 RepID=A0A8X8BDU0_BRACI|nr:hypothetical protein Bca52824_001342 [Brassica carinata]
MAMKSTGKSQLFYFNEISPDSAKSEIRFRLIHFYEARNIAKGGTFMGLEMLLIYEQMNRPLQPWYQAASFRIWSLTPRRYDFSSFIDFKRCLNSTDAVKHDVSFNDTHPTPRLFSLSINKIKTRWRVNGFDMLLPNAKISFHIRYSQHSCQTLFKLCGFDIRLPFLKKISDVIGELTAVKSTVTDLTSNKRAIYGDYQDRQVVEMSISDDTAEGLFVGFDAEMTKLHNMRAYEAGHLMDDADHDGDDMRAETPTAVTSLRGRQQ